MFKIILVPHIINKQHATPLTGKGIHTDRITLRHKFQ